MNRLAKLMIRLYPAKWRARYGDEMEALLGDTGADARVVTNLLAGGVRMQFSLWPFLKLAVVLGLIGVILGAGASFLMTPQYVSTAVVSLRLVAVDADWLSIDLNSRAQELMDVLLSRSVLARVITDPQLELYSEERKVAPFEDVIQRMRRDISVLNGPFAFRIWFLYADRTKAQQALQTIVANLMEENLKRTQFPTLFSVIDQPSLPISPVSPNRRVIILLGFVLGVVIALIWRSVTRSGFMAKRFAVSVIAFGITGSVVAGMADLAGLFGRQFVSTGTWQMQGGTPEQRQTLINAVSDEQSLVALIKDPQLGLYRDELSTKSLADVVEMMRRHLRITPSPVSLTDVGDGLLLRISFEDSDPYRAQRTVSKVMSSLGREFDRLHPYLNVPPRLLQPSTLRFLHAPSMPVMPVKPNRSVVAGIGAVVGVFTAAVIALIRRRWTPDSSVPVEALNG